MYVIRICIIISYTQQQLTAITYKSCHNLLCNPMAAEYKVLHTLSIYWLYSYVISRAKAPNHTIQAKAHNQNIKAN